MANADCTQVDRAGFELGLQDLEALASTLELLSALTAHPQALAEHLERVSDVLHVLGDYLGHRSQSMRTLGGVG
jgi:hypothetical protein